jgi:hypothetical protein
MPAAAFQAGPGRDSAPRLAMRAATHHKRLTPAFLMLKSTIAGRRRFQSILRWLKLSRLTAWRSTSATRVLGLRIGKGTGGFYVG